MGLRVLLIFVFQFCVRVGKRAVASICCSGKEKRWKISGEAASATRTKTKAVLSYSFWFRGRETSIANASITNGKKTHRPLTPKYHLSSKEPIYEGSRKEDGFDDAFMGTDNDDVR